jgi:hypothetical protein
MTYIWYKETLAGDFYFSYAKAPRKETLSLTAMMLEATGGYAEISEAEYNAGLLADKERVLSGVSARTGLFPENDEHADP